MGFSLTVSFLSCLCRCELSVLTVITVVHAELDEDLMDDVESIEDKIESEDRVIRYAEGDPRNEKLKKYEEELGLDTQYELVVMKKRQSIGCYFIVSCEERLMQLYGYFVSGVMKNVLEKIFALLVNTDKLIIISRLRWNSKEYWQSMRQLIEFKDQGLFIITNAFHESCLFCTVFCLQSITNELLSLRVFF